MVNPVNHFTNLTNPRVCVERTKVHLLDDIVFNAIAPIICGAESWNNMENYSKSKEIWLKGFLKLPNGIPSHDTFNRVFSSLNPKELETCFLDWLKLGTRIIGGEVASIDGKSIRGSRQKGSNIVHMISAWVNTNYMVFGQIKVEKNNDITATKVTGSIRCGRLYRNHRCYGLSKRNSKKRQFGQSNLLTK